ncbi:M28 family metallopeptidase [Fictibacillus sp. WQ 8-8]|uniref:M28 family metallopeptidase n=1 Tax=Fictibacillus sp. WQ 8-8 TaxID=2938788 RepID=UPI0021090D0D|nr:M28 family metallopeptidase [Fictibacillus sp. WQ 8-8]MCQ6268364.1 M28 family metallopeptidase [Fictibacillus sp. WQ 8-8]
MSVSQSIFVSEKALLSQVSKERLMEFTKEISKEVRLSGTEEELRAFQYAKAKLEEFGLDTELQFNDAYISLPGQAFLQVGGEDFECITHSMAKSVENIQAELVYVEKGTAPDYKNSNVSGKLVLVEGLATPGGVIQAAKHGAAGAVFINAKYTHEMIVSPVWGNPTPDTVELLPDIPVLSVNTSSGEHIKNKLLDNQDECKISAEVVTGVRRIPTLTAEIKGQEEPEKFVLFSGHIDSWHYGAMDNGTADAVILEVARVLAQHKNSLKRSLRLAFWSGHSHGRYAGSALYCDTNWEDLRENCVLHINIDSVGAKDSTVLTEANCMAETKHLAEDAIGSLAGAKFEGARFGRAGDQSFWGTGTPSLFMGLSEQEPSDEPAAAAFGQLFGAGKSGGFGWWWHTTEDTMDKIDPDNLERDCRIYLSIVYRTVSEPLLSVQQTEAVKDIEESLKFWQDKSQGHFDLSSALDRVKELKIKVQSFEQKLKTINLQESGKLKLANETIMELSRLLVPLNYVKGSNFGHDLAMKQSPVPKLDAIEKLVSSPKESIEYFSTQTQLLRNYNEVNYTLKKAIQLVDGANQGIVQ